MLRATRRPVVAHRPIRVPAVMPSDVAAYTALMAGGLLDQSVEIGHLISEPLAIGPRGLSVHRCHSSSSSACGRYALITKGDSIEACAIPKHDRGAITLPCAAASAPRSSRNRGFFCLLAFVRLLRPPIGVLSRQQSRCCTRAREPQGKSVGKVSPLCERDKRKLPHLFHQASNRWEYANYWAW